MQLVEMIHEAGLPDGVLNVVHGGKPTGTINENIHKHTKNHKKNNVVNFFFVS